MTITLNGQPTPIEPGTTVRQVVEARKLSPDKVAIELNRRLLRSDRYDQVLHEGDELEIVTFVGGG
jgi:thiamine biosynthesis protein ThiS